VNGVTADNLTVVNSVMADATFSESDTTAEVQVLVDVKASAISKISNWNSDADSANVPTEQDYADAETTNVNSSNLPTANSVLFEKSADESNTSLKIQTLINIQIAALSKISNWNENSNDADKPLSADYTYGEITSIINATLESANSVLINQAATDTNTRLKIQAIVDGEIATLVKIAYWSSNSNAIDEPSVADYQTVSVNNVNEANLITVNSVMADALLVEANTTVRVQNLVDVKVSAILLIADWANTSGTNGTTPTIENYTNAGVIGVNSDDVNVLNNTVRDTGVNTAANTTAKIQALADPIFGANAASLAKIANWGGVADSDNANVPTTQDYINVGVDGVNDDNLEIMNNVMAGVSSTDSDHTDEIQAIFDGKASAIVKIANYAGSGGILPTVQNYADAGVIGVVADNLSLVNATVAAATADEADTTAEIQVLFDSITDVSTSTLTANTTLIELNQSDHGAAITLQLKDEEGENLDIDSGLTIDFTTTQINASFRDVYNYGDGRYGVVVDSDHVGSAMIYAVIGGVQGPSIGVSWVDEQPPVLISLPEIHQRNENETGYITTIHATDYSLVQYSISGDDADFFEINAANGEVTYKNPLNFEQPLDEDRNNFYYFVAHATALGGTVSQGQNVQVLNVVEETDGELIFQSDTIFNGLIYKTLATKTGRIWLDRNIGARHVAKDKRDAESFGYYFQWGRGVDGHELSAETPTTSTQETDIHHNDTSAYFVLDKKDWTAFLDPDGHTRDAGWKNGGSNDICPNGFGIPTKDEWKTELAAYDIVTTGDAWKSIFKIPTGGYRHGVDGDWERVVHDPDYDDITRVSMWTRTNLGNSEAEGLMLFDADAEFDKPRFDDLRWTTGMPVRCINQL
jgi:uncharacterized protein (TIGR02145 family)